MKKQKEGTAPCPAAQGAAQAGVRRGRLGSQPGELPPVASRPVFPCFLCPSLSPARSLGSVGFYFPLGMPPGFCGGPKPEPRNPPCCWRRLLKATRRRTLGWLSQNLPQGRRVCHGNLPRCKLHALCLHSVIPPLFAHTSVKALSVGSVAQSKFCGVRWWPEPCSVLVGSSAFQQLP